MASQQDEELRDIFQRATEYVRSIVGNLDSTKLLYFYARYKQANEGACNTQRPGFFDFQGKQKWDAWHALGDKSKIDAMVEYVSELSNTDPEWEEQVGVKKSRSGLGLAVSTMANEDSVIPDNEKTIFDWLKEDDTKQVTNMLGKYDINEKDSEGMTLLHWACDRGLEDMVRLLLTSKADVNVRDADGQTPLHYAVSCEHVEVVRMLLQHGADALLVDDDGSSAADGTNNSVLLELLQGTT